MAETEEKGLTKLDKKGVETLSAILTNKTLLAAAKSLDISNQALHDRINKYNLRAVMDEIPQQALMTLQKGSLAAAENLVAKIHSEDNDVSLKATTETLDRVGLTKIQKDQGDTKNLNGLVVVLDARDKTQ
jgi:hypothetical protein